MNSFLQGKKSLSIPQLRPLHATPPPPLASAASTGTPAKADPNVHAHASSGGETSVEVVKEGDKVIRLIVTCTCGERVEIDCLYPIGSR